MTPDDIGDIGSATGQQLLENLIKEGLTPSGQDTDPSKYRKLIQVLLQNCILKPLSRDIPPNLQQAEYTLTILQRQTKLHPGIMYSVTQQEQSPFYYWLLPRLAQAAVHHIEDSLYDDLVAATVNALKATGRNSSEEDVSWAKGPRRLGMVVRHINSFCQELPANANTLIFLLSVVLQIDSPFLQSITSTSASLLSQTHKSLKRPYLESRYTAAITSALLRTRSINLTQGCIFVSSLTSYDEGFKREKIVNFYEALTQADPGIKAEVWWSLLDQAEALKIDQDIDFAKICFLVTPIVPYISSSMIENFITPGLLQRWSLSAQSDSLKADSFGKALGIDGTTSKKRKRSNDGSNTAVAVQGLALGIVPPAGNIEALSSREVHEIGPGIACAMAGCSSHVAPFLQTLSDDIFDFWIKLDRDDAAAVRTLLLLIEHTPPQTLATGIQLSRRQPVVDKLLRQTASTERPKRILARPISILLAEHINRSPEMVAETMQFIGLTRQNFLETNLKHILPALIMVHNKDALQQVASIVKQKMGVILTDHVSHILAQAFLHPDRTDSAINFLVKLLQDMMRGNPKALSNLSIPSLMTACMVDLIVMLIVELGDSDRGTRKAAQNALVKASLHQRKDEDVGAFLKPQMLGVISQLNDMLHDVQGKKSVEYKRKIIRSFGSLIRIAGDSMAGFSPQSTLGIPELREETLKAWALFITTLRYSDVGPFVGRTTGALVANWNTFDACEREIATDIINNIAENAKNLSQYVDEIVGLDDIKELKSAASRLTAQRLNHKIQEHISKVLDRSDSKNIAIATASTKELRSLLTNRQQEVEALLRGDTFDPIMSRLMTSLLATATRDGDCQELRDLSYECMGIVGALDPDRLGIQPDSGTMTIAANFTEAEESKDFALHLVTDLLVDAFRATNDTKHQTHLAYAIQELLKFCGFTTRLLSSTEKVNSKPIRDRWLKIPKDQLETLSPLLESRFSISDAPIKSFSHPIYSSAPTYREWLQNWTTDLIGKVMSISGDDIATRDSKTIFGAFRGVLRNQDVTVAHHILPHLVLYILLSGLPNWRKEISSEINAVLQEQVNPTGSADKRTLSAQVIFDLMDHLSKWLRLYRLGKNDRSTQIKIVEDVIAGIDTELMANAALQSKAYARSLRSFEERIVGLRNIGKDNLILQIYFERLHQIYSELDEPDGMEGVSAFVISPSLEHQIREHESTGRWTSAQSCWEVRLQQSPDDVTYHVGLLKCLRNLGHYASFEAEAAWIIGDWDTVKQIGANGPAIGQTLLALHEKRDVPPVLLEARKTIGSNITAKNYGRAYESLLQFHLIREVEMINTLKQEIEETSNDMNARAVKQKAMKSLVESLEARFNFTSPTFRVREALLSIRRTAFGLAHTPISQAEIGDAWILTSKIARKAGYDQTAYSAVLQAKGAEAPFAFIQQAKLNYANGGIYKALADVNNALTPLLKEASARSDEPIDLTEERDFAAERKLAKGKFPLSHMSLLFTCVALWGQIHISDDAKDAHAVAGLRGDQGCEIFLTAFPQIISRIVHPDQRSALILKKIMAYVIYKYPQQALWPTVGAMQSKRAERKQACQEVTAMASARTQTTAVLIKDATNFSSILLRFTDDKVDDKKRQMSMASDFSYVAKSKTKMILPLQDALTCSLPTTSETVRSHSPFPNAPVSIADIRTYAVMPLNEECGLLEWVANTNALKSILEKGYGRYGKKVYYTPTVFHEWFLITWPEPSAWLASRLAYGRTLAVMSMIGYVLGLGDRHGENILFDGLSGDTVHVDLNCLFDKNMVDALGVTGVEAAEISMAILRTNSDSLMSVLEAFVHDPLIEWMKSGRSKSEKDIKASADRNLKPIKAKLRGIRVDGTVLSVPSQVEALIKEATSQANLAAMYVGWAPWL
ncbi:uncharacterized protein I206_105480 [Kwoniella pini CBS 10737]|uniref:non-specific serine/threonine protein kinase n=1 Tax=Kwoniella pini CBS 10737 TaxID=1296096 RepID=A0AAJ8L9G1_9TREE